MWGFDDKLGWMRPRDVIELLVLSVLWGGAYLFTRAAVPAFGPAPLVSMRLGIAALMLLPILFWRGGWPQLRANLWRCSWSVCPSPPCPSC